MVRDDILKELEKNRGNLISGGQLARELGVSRTAIWKAISSLKKDGFNIKTIKNEGYVLSSANDIMTSAGIDMFLQTEKIGRDLLVISETESTNTDIKRKYASEKSHGFTLISHAQTKGRGRLGRTFHSMNGDGIYMSILLKPSNIPISEINFLTIAAAVAVCGAIKEVTDLEVDIKWVNDIYKNGKKLCGILTEASIEGETGNVDFIVVGIGINVRLTNIPEEIINIAASLSDFTERELLRNNIVSSVLNHFESCYNLIIQGKKDTVLEEYRNHIRFLGNKILYTTTDGLKEATAVSVNENGHLVIKKDDGNLETLYAGEISIKI